jgi:hypothetical protein
MPDRITNGWLEETAIQEGAIAMSAEAHRPVAIRNARPQVGRFYGDFLCMASIRKNGGPLALMRAPLKFSLDIKRLSVLSHAGAGAQSSDIAGEFRG